MNEKLEVRRIGAGEYRVSRKLGSVMVTVGTFLFEGDAELFTSAGEGLAVLRLLDEMIGDTNELRAMLDGLVPGLCNRINAAIDASRVPEKTS